MMTALGLAAAIAGQALAGPPGSPVENQVYSDCTFDPSQLDGILQIGHPNAFPDVYDNDSSASAGDIVSSFIVIYRRDTQNNGQILDGATSGATGPVVCVANTDSLSATAESVPIPNSADHDASVTSVDILATQGGSTLQYRLNAPGAVYDDRIEDRHCLSTDTGVDCVLIQQK